MIVPFIEIIKTVMGEVRQDLEIKSLALDILSEDGFGEDIKT